MTNVLVSAKVLDAQVGGNTRYARAVYAGIGEYGITHRCARPPWKFERTRAFSYAAMESFVWPLRPGDDIDLIHYPADTGAQIVGRVPIVSTIHGLATLHVPNVRSAYADKLWRQRVTRLIACSNKIITVSSSSANDIARIAPAASNKIVTIPHGIDHGKFTASSTLSDSERVSELGVRRPYFLYVGNIEPRKNLVRLCHAAGEVYRAAGIPLVVSGAPAWDSGEIVATIDRSPGVHYLGRVGEDALVPLIRNALAFCFPSLYEGFGFPVIEAMACGTAVMCSDRGALKEVSGDAALTVDPLRTADIGEAMLKLARDSALRNDLRARGIENARRFQWRDSIEAHSEVFAEARR